MVLRQKIGYEYTAPSTLANPSPLLCDNISPKTHDFLSLTTSIDPIDAQVILALKLKRGSGASVFNDGNRLYEIKKMGDSAQSEIKGLIREALSRLIEQRDIQYRGIKFDVWDPANQTASIVVQWINLRARDSKVRSHPIEIPGATP
jgi:hypothetical protein